MLARMTLHRPSREAYALVLFMGLAAVIAVTPWLRGGLGRYPHLWFWEAVIAVLAGAYIIRYRRADEHVGRQLNALWFGLAMVIFFIRN
jgi:FtsH-binding integral membrane protein